MFHFGGMPGGAMMGLPVGMGHPFGMAVPMGMPFAVAHPMGGIGLGHRTCLVPFGCRHCGSEGLTPSSLDEVFSCPRCGASTGKTVLEHIQGIDGTTTRVDTSSRNDRLDSNVRTLYHQTSPEFASEIIRSQRMRRGNPGLAGSGIYFAESARETEHKAQKKGAMLRATVRLGRVKTVSSNGDSSVTFASLQAEGYDSVRIPRPGGTEYVVYNWDQVTSIERD
jgi:rubredoxin